MRAPDEQYVDDGDQDEPAGDRPVRRDVRDEARDGDRGKCDQGDGRRLCDETVRAPGDEPQPRRYRQAESSCPGQKRRPDRSRPRETVCAAEPKRGDAAGERGRRHEIPYEDEAVGRGTLRRACRDDDRRLHRAQHGVGGSETQWSGASGRLRIPSVVCHFDQESCSAAISSSTKRGDAFTRATTAPGTSPSSTSCSIRAKVRVNSYREKLMFAKLA